MGYKKILLACLTLVSPFLLFAVPAHAEGGLAAYPTTIEVRDAIRGGRYFKTLGIINSTPDRDYLISMTYGGATEGWASLHSLEDRETRLSEVIVPAGARTQSD